MTDYLRKMMTQNKSELCKRVIELENEVVPELERVQKVLEGRITELMKENELLRNFNQDNTKGKGIGIYVTWEVASKNLERFKANFQRASGVTVTQQNNVEQDVKKTIVIMLLILRIKANMLKNL